MLYNPVVCLVQNEFSDGQPVLLLIGLVATFIGAIFLIRFLAKSAGLAFFLFLIALMFFVSGVTNNSDFPIIVGLVLGVSSALGFVLALIGAVSRGVGRAVTAVTGSETLGQLATLGTAVAIGGTVLGELGLDSEGLDSGIDDPGLGGAGDLSQAGAASGAHLCVDGEIQLGEHPGPEGFGAPSEVDGDPRVNPVHGYTREAPDGSQEYVRPHWKGDRG
jgi:hypothetical protein